MWSYCYGSDSDSDDDDYVPRAKQCTATCPIIPSLTQTQSPSEPYPHKYQREKDDIEPAECGHHADRENDRTRRERQMDGNGCEHEGLAHEGDKTHEHERLEHGTDGICKLRELVYKLHHDHNEANRCVHPNHNLLPAPSATCDNHAQPQVAHFAPNTPTPTLPPPPSSPMCAMSPMVNQPGHVTASNHTQRASVFNDVKHELAPANGGTLAPHTTYLACTWCHPPLSWSTSNGDETCPHHIEDSHPLFSQHKRHCYKRSRQPCTPWTCDPHTPQSSIHFSSHSDASSTLTTAQVSVTPFVTGKLNHKNLAHQSNNNNTTRYPTIRPHPPPWPIKYLDRN
jgi:hypothetical protein